MKKTALLALTSVLTLAACGQTITPTTPSASGANVKVRIISAAFSQSDGLHTLGLPKNASLTGIRVNIRDTAGHDIYLKDGVYAPGGASVPGASSSIVLNQGNGYGQTVLLPKGDYTFENAGKFEDEETNALLSYGSAEENTARLDQQTNAVSLRFHGVLDLANSKLDFAMNTQQVFTNDTVNLKLYANSESVHGEKYALPLNDLIMNTAAPYTLSGADATRKGSAVGVTVTARGTVQDPNMRVTANLSAWVRQGDSDVALLQPVNLPAFQHAVATSAITADTEGPYAVTLDAVGTVTPYQTVVLTGTAYDDRGVTGIQVYDDNTLVAATNPSDSEIEDGVRGIDTDGDGHWSTIWTPETTGTHQLLVVARDAAGNESNLAQPVGVSEPAPEPTPEPETNYITVYGNGGGYGGLVLQPGQSLWIKTDYVTFSQPNNNLFLGYMEDEIDNTPDNISVVAYNSLNGTPLPANPNTTVTNRGGQLVVSSSDAPSGTFWVKFTNNDTSAFEFGMWGGSFQ
ncbi:Ig-like domain-containing protein [Deinococcus sonorensis]|uniref:Ig-like domain-containing protein n=1 Tax=Deinococcus sonorensis TaxID=309891 RepID=A0ABV8YBF8_9DEIO